MDRRIQTQQIMRCQGEKKPSKMQTWHFRSYFVCLPSHYLQSAFFLSINNIGQIKKDNFRVPQAIDVMVLEPGWPPTSEETKTEENTILRK